MYSGLKFVGFPVLFLDIFTKLVQADKFKEFTN